MEPSGGFNEMCPHISPAFFFPLSPLPPPPPDPLTAAPLSDTEHRHGRGNYPPDTHAHTHPEGHGPRLLVREPISTIITLRSHFGWGASMLGAPVPPPYPPSLSSSLPSPQTGNGEIKLQTTGPKCLISRRPTAPAEPSPARGRARRSGGRGQAISTM